MNHEYGYFEEDHIGRIGDIKLWRNLLVFILPQWRWIALAVILALGITASTLFLPRLVQLGMDRYIIEIGRASCRERV